MSTFSAPWQATENDVATFCRSDAWIKFVKRNQTSQKHVFELIQQADVAYTESPTAAEAHLPMRQMFAQSFDDYYEHDERSKAQRTEFAGENLKPDMDMLASDTVVNKATRRWSNVQAFIGLKSSANAKKAGADFSSAILKATSIFQNQYGNHRSHTVTASIYGYETAYYVVDRSGVTISRSFDIKQDARQFLRCHAGFLVLDERWLEFRSPDDPSSFKVTFGQTEYTV